MFRLFRVDLEYDTQQIRIPAYVRAERYISCRHLSSAPVTSKSLVTLERENGMWGFRKIVIFDFQTGEFSFLEPSEINRQIEAVSLERSDPLRNTQW